MNKTSLKSMSHMCSVCLFESRLSVCAGCEYGDRVDWCSSLQSPLSDACRGANIASQCCQSCQPFVTVRSTKQSSVQLNSSDASFKADTRTDCSAVSATECYLAGSAGCCKTCESKYTGVHGNDLAF